jgi:hypothetical protein
MLESELEISIEPDDDTEAELEYLTIDWFANDYAAVLAGKFLSPVGQFRQNLHSSWINKLPTAPPGFGHDGAAPISEMWGWRFAAASRWAGCAPTMRCSSVMDPN